MIPTDCAMQQRDQRLAPVPGLLQHSDGRRRLRGRVREAALLGDLPGKAVLLPHTLRLRRPGLVSVILVTLMPLNLHLIHAHSQLGLVFLVDFPRVRLLGGCADSPFLSGTLGTITFDVTKHVLDIVYSQEPNSIEFQHTFQRAY